MPFVTYEDASVTYEQATFTYEGGGSTGPGFTSRARIFPPHLLVRARISKRQGYPDPLPSGAPGLWGGITDTRLYVRATIHQPAASIFGLQTQANIIPGRYLKSTSLSIKSRIASHQMLTMRARIFGPTSNILPCTFTASGDYTTSLAATFVVSTSYTVQSLAMRARIVPSGRARLVGVFSATSLARTLTTVRTFDWNWRDGGQQSFSSKARIVG